MHIIISSIIFHVRWNQKFPDITLDLVRYLYLLIIIIPFLSKLWHIKRVAGYLFCTGRIGMHIIISSIICHVRWYQIFPDTMLNFVSYLYLFAYQYTVFVKIRAYKTSNWVFILPRKKCYTYHYIKHHFPRQMIPDISRYHA